jgi:predicted amidohydrolase YtcJ
MRGGTLILFAVVANAAAGCFSEPSTRNVEVLYLNGHVWTGDPQRPEATAFVVREGMFAFVGSDAEARERYPDAERVDLQQRRVTPGLVDSHSHLVRVAAEWKCDADAARFDPAYSNDDLATMELSRLQRAEDHYQTNLSGRTPVDDRVTIADRAGAKKGIECATYLANAMGLTASVEAGIKSWDFLELLQEVAREGQATMRHHLYLTPPLVDEAIMRGIHAGHGDDWVRVAGVKLYSDGWLGPRTSALTSPYNDRPGSRGVLFLEQAEADRWVERVHQAGLKPAAHAIGDQGVATLLNAYEKQAGAAARFTLEHASIVQPRDVERIARLGVVVSFQLSFATSDHGFAQSALGSERVKWTYAWRTLWDAGVVMAGGSDFPNEPMAPLWGLQRVVTRQELDGSPPGGWFPDQRLTVSEALTSVTRNAAFDVFFENKTGQIRAGMLADFVVLDQDLLAVAPDQIARTCVEQTVVGGRIVYDRSLNDLCDRFRFNGRLATRTPQSRAALDDWVHHVAHAHDLEAHP